MPGGAAKQTVRFCVGGGGARIAFAVHGSGPPLLVSTCWFSHLQQDWESPVWLHFLEDLGRIATVIRFDERGSGLSDRDVTDFSLEARVEDLEAVAEAAGYDRFALMAMSQGGGPSITYVSRHPERVTRLLFYNSSACLMPDPTPEELELNEVYLQMIKVGYARPDSTFRRVFTSMTIPSATEEQMRWLDDLQRFASTAENSAGLRRELALVDVRHLLADIHVPTLVLHSRGDRNTTFAKGRFLASEIPGSRLVTLESENHIVLGDESAWQVFVHEVDAFLSADRAGLPHQPASPLSPREREVLAMAAHGKSNDAIAADLHLSVRTVERHLHNAYAKLGVAGRSARAAAVSHLLSSR
jgi:pimeloyl-ACP methyl ester carboxylesterase/DNA-binding CsgD family transcriptional regulator